MSSTHSVDILILTALREEYDQVLAVRAGAFEGSTWQVRPGPLGHEVAFRTFTADSGEPLEVAVTWATSMGGVATAGLAERLVAEYKPRCLAMCGVCAGRRGDVQIGDVIVADRMWMYDTGKLKVEFDKGQRIVLEQGDVLTYNLRDDWERAAKSLVMAKETVASWGKRPRPSDLQADWILERLLQNEDPRQHSDVDTKAPNFDKVIELLWKKNLVDDGTLTLTDEGKMRIDKLLIKHFKGLPDMLPFRVHVGPIGSGNKVVQDPQIFDCLASTVRKVLGLEMEAMAIGAVAHAHQDKVRYMVVMKGVMDHADDWKNDTAKTFAARASAECLLAFLRKQLPPVDRFGDILDSGTAEKPTTPAPSALLHAKHRYISFYRPGRQAILERLVSFCEGASSVGVWLIHGDGGMGKTRLMIEFCKEQLAKGWRAGFLPGAAKLERFEALVASDVPALVVIDYAESRPELAELLNCVNGAQKRGAPLRVVLLARNADDWWTMLVNRNSTVKPLLLEQTPTLLEKLVEPSERDVIVRKVANEFARVKGKPLPSSTLPSLDDNRFARTLYLHLAALAWVEGIAFTADSLMDEILAHEERFWVTQANALKDAVGEEVFVEQMREAVAAMTLCGGIVSKAAGKALLRRLNERVDDRLLAFLHRLYPATTSAYTSPLEPDLLGEAMVWRTMGFLLKRGDKPEEFLDRVFEGETDHSLTTGFHVLGRLSVEHSDGVRPWIRQVLETDLPKRALLALEAAKTLGAKTAHAWVGYELAQELKRAGTVELARQLEKVGLLDPTVSLREVREWASRTLLTLHPADDESIEGRNQRAQRLNIVGVQQGALGQHDAALESIQEAVAIHRKLVERQPDAFLPELAKNLNNLGARQSALGQYEAALVSTHEAVDIRRKLADQRPDDFLPTLAISLNNLGTWQSAMGQREAALVSTQEALDIRCKLAEQRRDEFLPDLATSLNNLGIRQSALGQHEAALVSTQHAVGIRRKLVEQKPDEFLPDLAMSLNNLGIRQSALGQHEAALVSTQEALGIRCKLAEQLLKVFLPDLAKSLNNLGKRQSALGQHETALVSTQKAVDIRRKLAEQRPGKFLPDLAKSLNNLGNRQSDLGQHEAALVSTQEAVYIRRKLTEQWPDKFLPDLATSLNNLGERQSAFGQHEPALAFTQEALDIRRKLAEQWPDKFLPNLATSLNNQGNQQSALGQHEVALVSTQEALDIHWRLYKRFPLKYEQHVRKTFALLETRHQTVSMPIGAITLAQMVELDTRSSAAKP